MIDILVSEIPSCKHCKKPLFLLYVFLLLSLLPRFRSLYIKEANGSNKNSKHDFYGANYNRLFAIRNKYGPRGSLYVSKGLSWRIRTRRLASSPFSGTSSSRPGLWRAFRRRMRRRCGLFLYPGGIWWRRFLCLAVHSRTGH